MKKRMLDIAIVMTVLLALGGTAYGADIRIPDNCTTSLLLAGVAGALAFARRFVR